MVMFLPKMPYLHRIYLNLYGFGQPNWTISLWPAATLHMSMSHLLSHTHRVNQNHPYTYGVHTVFLAGKSSNIRSYTVYIHGSGQPYTHPSPLHTLVATNTRTGGFRPSVISCLMASSLPCSLPTNSRRCSTELTAVLRTPTVTRKGLTSTVLRRGTMCVCVSMCVCVCV